MNMKQKILDYIKANPTVPARVVASKLGTKVQYVHSVKYLEGKKSKATRRKNARPPEVPTFKREDSELRDLRIAVSQHAHIVDRLKKEIVELTTIIAYLEHRCFKAEGPRGPAI